MTLLVDCLIWGVGIIVVAIIAIRIADKKKYMRDGIARLEHWLNAKDENDSD